jgi:transcriptional regulator with XRE-family HTH domain
MPKKLDTTNRRTPLPIARAQRSIGADLAVWRKLRGITQAQLADRADVARTTVGRLEHGDGSVSLENVLRVMRALGLVDAFARALDPYESEVGRLRADEQLPRRVRPRRLDEPSDG